MKNKILFTILFFVSFLLFCPIGNACTSLLITKGASADGSSMISYASDSHTTYGELYFWPAADYPEGSMRDIYDWDTGKYLGKIKQVPHTFSVVGNINEYQVAIGESTFDDRVELRDLNAGIDYGSLMYVALQRAKTAREAIRVMTDLVAEYGYYSTGESFSIADPNEVWIMEMVGKGPKNKGAVWVALKIPDGYVGAHANQGRITHFKLPAKNNWNDLKQTTFAAPDVISFARSQGYFNGQDKEFSFSDTYAPVNFAGARMAEARVWAFFRKLSDNFDQYNNYVTGHVVFDANGYATNRMPLWIKPNRKVSLKDMTNFMRDHYEETAFDMTKDLGADPYQKPYRWRPLTWKVDGVEYFNERAIATQQTAFVFIAELRSWMPNPIGGILWFGVDDAAHTVFVPMYCGMTEVPDAYKQGNGGLMDYARDAAFWTFNEVANLAYTRYRYIHRDVMELQQALENKYIAYTPVIDKAALTLYKKDPKLARQFITDYSVNTGNSTVATWRKFYEHLFVKYMDGNIKTKVAGQILPKVEQPGYTDEWYRRIIKETGNKFKVIESPNPKGQIHLTE